MYAKIKELADEAIALQNKDRMDVALREIVILCAQADSIKHGFVYIGPDIGTPNPVVLGGPVGEIVARCPEADAYLAAHAVAAPVVPAAAAKAAESAKAKKGGAK